VEYSVEFRKVPAKVTVSSSNFTIRVESGSISRLKGHAGIPVEIACGGRPERKVVVQVFIRTFGKVIGVSRQLQRHHGISREDLTTQRLETTGLPDDVILSEDEIQGKRTVRIVNANTVLCGSMLERTPAVNEEDEVTVIVRTGRTTVTSRGIAKQEGSVGDVITVQPAGSHERMTATVLNNRSVLVDLGGAPLTHQDN
jgi:flagella basal body P-ring formation protein FlgA